MLNGIQLDLDRCPHCGIAKPYLKRATAYTTHMGYWACYNCQSCGGVVMTLAAGEVFPIHEMWPEMFSVSDSVPERARGFLMQAAASLHAPAGAVMLTASAVDAMLKAKGYKEGNLYGRINKAAEDHLITAEMAEWAHEVRLDANDQRPLR